MIIMIINLNIIACSFRVNLVVVFFGGGGGGPTDLGTRWRGGAFGAFMISKSHLHYNDWMKLESKNRVQGMRV